MTSPKRTKTKISSVRFTKASEKDRIKVTVALKELAEFIDSYESLDRGCGLIVELPGPRKVYFEVNRAGKTAATNAWPLIQPHVGRPVQYHVISVTRVGSCACT